MFGKSTLYAILITALSVLLIACDDGGEPAAKSFRSSPPPPALAPVSMVQTVTPLLSSASTAETETCPGAESEATGGKPVAVNLEDPNGSGKYQFDPDVDLTFDVGETVEFTLTAETEFHTFTICDLKIDQSLLPGDTTVFSFTFDKAGIYELICTPHESLGMVSKITVK